MLDDGRDSGVITRELVLLSDADDGADRSFTGFALSVTRFTFPLELVLGSDGVIESDFGKSGSFRLDPKIALYLLLSCNFVIDTDGLESFAVPADDLLFEFALLFELFAFDLLPEPFEVVADVGAIAVDVIDNELLMRFCCNPSNWLPDTPEPLL